MTSWAKNQIAKQLARFVKNLDPSQISLKFLKGEGELSNLELNEQVLTDLLELPPWLQLKKATCNRICTKIHWTSLKTDPIQLFLDCVEVDIFASETGSPKPHDNVPSHQKYSSKDKPQPVKTSKYGFAEKVVDGMYVSINSVLVSFKASGFRASFSMSRFIVQSTDPYWNVANNLRKTRIKDEQRGEVMIFKQIKWGTMRLDADAAYAETAEHGSIPIRLITNNSAVHLTIKKRLSDCSLISSRLEIIFDDILWILTQSQLLKLSSFVHFLLKVRQKFLPMAKHTEAQKDHKPMGNSSDSGAPHRPNADLYQGTGHGSNLNKFFTEHDVIETSYHLKTNRIDLHLCDDQTLSSSETAPRSFQHNGSSDSPGALLISIQNFKMDHYPYHIANLKRKLARSSDDDALFSRRQWAQQLFDFFLKNEGKEIGHFASQQAKSAAPSRRPLMYESFFLISCTKFAIMQVSTSDRQEPMPFLSSDKEGLFLPEDMNSFLLDFTSYYFIGYRNLPVPPSNMFLKMNPMKLVFHPLTCIWLNKFIQSVVTGLEWTKEFLTKESAPPEHLDIRIECLMPQVTVPCDASFELPHSSERPKALQIQISQAVISNSRIGVATSQSDLLMDVQDALASHVYSRNNDFPNSQTDYGPLPNEYWVNDYSILHRRFWQAYLRCRTESLVDARHPVNSQMGMEYSNIPGQPTTFGKQSTNLAKDLMNPRVIWCIWCEQIWIDFIGIEKSCGRPVTFIDAVPMRLWLSFPVVLPRESSSIEEDIENRGSFLQDIYTQTERSMVDATSLHTTVKTHVTKTGSCTSLPATLKSQQEFFSNSSSNSSISMDSVASNTIGNEAAKEEVSSSTKSRATPYEHVSPPFGFQEPSLKTSYSETDLMLSRARSYAPGSSSSQEFPVVVKDVRVEAPGPPPPYSASALANVSKADFKVNSSESLPPVYTQLPTYNAVTLDEGASQITEKTSKEVLDFFKCRQENEGNGSNDPKKITTIGSILHVTKSTSIQLDHFQLLFLLRIQEMLQEVATKITDDSLLSKTVNSPLHQDSSFNGKSFSMHMSLPSIDLNIVLPPSMGIQNEQFLSLEERIESGKLTRFFELIKQTRDGESRKNQKTESKGGLFLGNSQHSSTQSGSCNLPVKELYASKENEDISKSVEGVQEGKPSQRMEESLIKDVSKCDLNELTLNGIETTAQWNKNSAVSDGNTLFDVPANPEDHVFITDDPADEREYDEREAGDEVVNYGKQLEACEAEGRHSAGQQYVMVVEASTQTDAVACTVDNYEFFKNEGVSVIRSKCKDLRIAIQSENSDSVVKVTVGKIRLKEDGDVTYGMTLDHRLPSGKDTEKEDCLFLDSKPQIKLRLISGPVAEQFADGASEMGFAHIKVSNLDANLLLSNIESLGEFIEDEYLLKKMPFKIELENIEVKLFDDKPRRYISALLPPPIELKLKSLVVFGSTGGQITIGENLQDLFSERTVTGSISDASKEEEGGRREGFYEENLLKSSGDADSGIGNIGTVKEQSALIIEENERLIDDLKLANARMVSLEQERDAILKVVEKLQQELMWSNHENEKLAEKVKSYKIYLRDLGKR
ncbi:bridge-like lipid transfer protein family member 3B [Rhopilema esculentum]|uniref:bridge-like lipid transfer protein family member 3B n=1 Tax=Rhopilema esculentum TaxID=499914 RepID=UPI0031E07C0A